MLQNVFLMLCFLFSVISCDFEKTPEKAITAKRDKSEDMDLIHLLKTEFVGDFAASIETESTSTGRASISYVFSISPEFIGLKTSTYHEPIRCNGKYEVFEKNNLLELYYKGSEAFCDIENPMFFLKIKKGKLFAKGLGGEGTYTDWIRLKKK